MKILLKVLLVVLWVAIGAGAVLLMGFANISHAERKFSGIDVSISYYGADRLISESDVKQIIYKNFGDIRKQRIGALNLEEVRNKLADNPYILDLDILCTVEGILNISLEQPRPVARLINDEGRSWLVSENGSCMPYNYRYPVRLPVATGALQYPASFGSQRASKSNTVRTTDANTEIIRHVSGLVLGDTLLNALIEQINIDPNGNMKLYTKLKKPVIDFGDSLNAPEKFANLKAFLRQGLMRQGSEKYYEISLRYKNQVVCKK